MKDGAFFRVDRTVRAHVDHIDRMPSEETLVVEETKKEKERPLTLRERFFSRNSSSKNHQVPVQPVLVDNGNVDGTDNGAENKAKPFARDMDIALVLHAIENR